MYARVQHKISSHRTLSHLLWTCDAHTFTIRTRTGGADIRAKDKEGKTALHWCVSNTSARTARLLIHLAPDLLRERDREGRSPLHLALAEHNAIVIEALLDASTQDDLAIADDQLRTALHWAAACDEVRSLFDRDDVFALRSHFPKPYFRYCPTIMC